MTTLDYRNINSLWASIIVETFSRLGLKTAVTCPGSRSTPLTVALARHPKIDVVPILDERSAAFFALGCAKREHRPVAVVCTSGTAGANFYPAVIEAAMGKTPVIFLTADRPPELRDCSSGQTIDQQKLFGSFTNWYSELALPKIDLLDYIRQTIIHAWHRTCFPQAGPVHLNCPFRDPLAPLPDCPMPSIDSSSFFAAVSFYESQKSAAPEADSIAPLIKQWQTISQGIIIAGPSSPRHPQQYCRAVAEVSQQLGWPILADALSPLRNYQQLNPLLISSYDILLRSRKIADRLVPKVVLQLEALPTSKVLRQWLKQNQVKRYILSQSHENLDPLHGHAQAVYGSILSLNHQIDADKKVQARPEDNSYSRQWLGYEQNAQTWIETYLSEADQCFEGKISRLLSTHLPADSQLFISNSMPIRDMESFWQPNNSRIETYFNRGANGIDGILSTAMGIAHGGKPTFLLTGDLAFLHDTNALLSSSRLDGQLTIVVINNQGGGIFEMLPIANFNPPFENYFATPQAVEISYLCKAYGIEHQAIGDCAELITQLRNSGSHSLEKGVRVWEICTNRKADAAYRQSITEKLEKSL